VGLQNHFLLNEKKYTNLAKFNKKKDFLHAFKRGVPDGMRREIILRYFDLTSRSCEIEYQVILE